MRVEFWRANLKERVHVEDVCVDEKIILKWILNKEEGRDSYDSGLK
jgi:hypothetical protein